MTAAEDDDAGEIKRLLFCLPSPREREGLLRALAPHVDGELSEASGILRFAYKGTEFALLSAYTIDATLEVLEHQYVNLLVVDLRSSEAGDGPHSHSRLWRILATLDDVEDTEARYAFHHILVLLSGVGDSDDPSLVELGGYGVRHTLKQHAPGADGTTTFGRRLLDEALRLTSARTKTVTALCAAGGGITAIYFELAALKCLDDCLGGGVHAFDMYFGISAGAVVNSVVACGYAPEEFMAAIAGVPGGRIAPLSLSLLKRAHLNLGDIQRRLSIGLRSILGAAGEALRLRRAPSLDAAFLAGTALIGAPFQSDAYEHMLRTILTAPNATNDFRALPRKLYIGTSNQHTRRHQLFGELGWDHVPVSKAVQASLSLNPAFAAVEIDGQYFEDGAVTRTSNFIEAIDRGANVILVFDPFVPYVAPAPGFSNRRGMLFNIDQDVRSLSFTRYENARNCVLRRHPEISTYTFLPDNPLRELLSINPMDHRPFLEIWRRSYLATLRRIAEVEHRLRGDLAACDISLDTSRAKMIGERLERAGDLCFGDFFADGEVRLRTPPLALDSGGASGRRR
jgi:predicted acylesterase/phospholipase RssA